MALATTLRISYAIRHWKTQDTGIKIAAGIHEQPNNQDEKENDMKNNQHKAAKKEKSALQAKSDAQRIAFGPFVFQAVVAMRELGILDAILKHKHSGLTPEELAGELNISLYGIKTLLEVGLKSEIVRVDEERYSLTNTGYFLAKDELTSVNINFVKDVCYQGMFYLSDSIKEQRPIGLKTVSDKATVYEALSTLPQKVQKSWFNFDQFYSDIAFPEVLPIVFSSRPKHILDIGGNTGKWAVQCCQYNNDVEITIVDLPGQLEKAAQNIREQGLEKRVHMLARNLLEKEITLPANADVIWMSQFLDCFSEDQIVDILKLIKKVMNNTTRLYIMELFWDRQRFEAASFSLVNTSLYFTCLANGNSKIYSSGEFVRCIEKAGLHIKRDIDEIGPLHTLLECGL